jgi:hypothetical protein
MENDLGLTKADSSSVSGVAGNVSILIWNRANTGLAPGGGYFSFVNVNQYRGFTANAVPGNLTLLPALAATALGLPRSINTPRQLQLAIKFDF